MNTFTKSDTNKMSWDEFDGLINVLNTKVDAHFSEHGGEINVISQLHRTGGIVGSMLAIRMQVIPLLPVQFKYSYDPTKIDQIISVPQILVDVPGEMNILLCEGKTSTGSIAKRASSVIKEKYPKAKIYLATVVKLFGCPDKIEGIEHIFHGRMTDKKFSATPEQIVELDLRQGITIFPWESVEDELMDINTLYGSKGEKS